MLRHSAFVVALSLSAAVSLGQSWTLTTLAGSTSGGGYVDANGTDARFSWPHGVTVDTSGNVFVADRGNHVIRKITPSGDVTTVAGMAGVPGSSDGVGSAARFYFPAGIAFDATTANLFVADSWNHTIRKVTPSGVVTTYAGTAGVYGHADGSGNNATFEYPQDVAVDQSGFVWVADTGNHAIRRIVGMPAAVTTFAGSMAGLSGSSDGIGTSARFNTPFGIAVDANGDLWVADSYNNEIRKVTREGVVTTVAGSAMQSGSTDGVGSAALFDDPWGIAVAPSGDVWVADSGNDKIRKVTTAGAVTTVAGTSSYGTRNGAASQARFAFPTGIAFDSSDAAYIADRESEVIRKISPALVVTTFAGSAPSGGAIDGIGTNARLFFPAQAVTDASGNIYYADSANTIRKITPDGAVTTIAGLAGMSGSADGTGSAALFNSPSGIALDANGNLWVADTYNHTIRKINSLSVVTTVAGAAGVKGKADGIGSQAHFNYPCSLAFDSTGKLYIADTYNHLIRVMDQTGVVTTYAGSGQQGSFDSSALSASFSYPVGVAVDANRNVFVADFGNDEIREITASGTVKTLAGNSSGSGFDDGPGKSAHFDRPYAVAVDASGNVFVADSSNQEIRKVSSGGVVSTILGLPESSGNVDGTTSAARLNYPEAVTIDQQGRLIISDTYNDAIRVATIGPPTIASFTASPSAITPGYSVTLSWATSGATAVTINPGIGNVPTSGTRFVFPSQTTTYLLTAYSSGGNSTAQVTVTVLNGTTKRRAVAH